MFWTLLTYAAWGGSAIIAIWMLSDLLRVNKEYDEDMLVSSREGSDELLEEDQKS